MLTILGPERMYSATDGVTMHRAAGKDDGFIVQHEALELKLSPLASNGPDPRLIELVRLLARRAARQCYKQMLEKRRGPRS